MVIHSPKPNVSDGVITALAVAVIGAPEVFGPHIPHSILDGCHIARDSLNYFSSAQNFTVNATAETSALETWLAAPVFS